MAQQYITADNVSGSTGTELADAFNDNFTELYAYATYATVQDMVLAGDVEVGDSAKVLNYSDTCQSGVLDFVAVPSDTGTADGGSYIDGDGVQWEQIFGPVVAMTSWGAGSGLGDDSARANDCFTYMTLGASFRLNNQTKVIAGTNLLAFNEDVQMPNGISFEGNGTYVPTTTINKIM
jgi:hypothetical protein